MARSGRNPPGLLASARHPLGDQLGVDLGVLFIFTSRFQLICLLSIFSRSPRMRFASRPRADHDAGPGVWNVTLTYLGRRDSRPCIFRPRSMPGACSIGMAPRPVHVVLWTLVGRTSALKSVVMPSRNPFGFTFSSPLGGSLFEVVIDDNRDFAGALERRGNTLPLARWPDAVSVGPPRRPARLRHSIPAFPFPTRPPRVSGVWRSRFRSPCRWVTGRTCGANATRPAPRLRAAR